MATEAETTPAQGQLLAGRYRLQERSRPDDGTGAELWHGVDEMLARPVAVRLRTGDSAETEALLATAVTAGRVTHPRIASVYDAAQTIGCTYVVSEWVDGLSLAALIRQEGPLDPARAAALLQPAAEAVAALHARDTTHGNLRPETLLVGADGQPKLVGLRGDPRTPQHADVRALGGLLYAALSGRWPGPEQWSGGLGPAPYADNRMCSPRQVRAGVPGDLSALAMGALAVPESGMTAAGLAVELGRHAHGHVSESLPLARDDLVKFDDRTEDRPRWRRIVVPLSILVVTAVAGLLLGISFGAFPVPKGAGVIAPFGNAGTGGQRKSAAPVATIPVTSAKILDPQGDGTELKGAQNTYDGNLATDWHTDWYTKANFGNFKQGMGVLFDLGSAHLVRSVTVTMRDPGADLELRNGDTDSADPATYQSVASQRDAASTVTLRPATAASTRYWLLWITKLPPNPSGQYQIFVSEVAFH